MPILLALPSSSLTGRLAGAQFPGAMVSA
jgi:hypothetical protein